MRDNGIGVSNERASLLLKILKVEVNVTPLDPTLSAPVRRASDEPQEGAA